MTMTLEIEPELEAALRDVAEREGLDPAAFAVKTLREAVGKRENTPQRLSREESALLQQINQGLPAETWRRYHDLVAKRRAETLTPEEQTALIALSDEVEAWNVRRLGLVIELSRLRNVPVPTLMKELGLTAPPYA